MRCVCVYVFDMGLAGCCARGAFVRNKRHTHYVPMCLFFRTKARENARMQAQCECNRTSGEQCSIYACECLACSYVRKKRHMCLLFRTSGKQRMWPVCVSMLKLAELGLGEPWEKIATKAPPGGQMHKCVFGTAVVSRDTLHCIVWTRHRNTLTSMHFQWRAMYLYGERKKCLKKCFSNIKVPLFQQVARCFSYICGGQLSAVGSEADRRTATGAQRVRLV